MNEDRIIKMEERCRVLGFDIFKAKGDKRKGDFVKCQ